MLRYLLVAACAGLLLAQPIAVTAFSHRKHHASAVRSRGELSKLAEELAELRWKISELEQEQEPEQEREQEHEQEHEQEQEQEHEQEPELEQYEEQNEEQYLEDPEAVVRALGETSSREYSSQYASESDFDSLNMADLSDMEAEAEGLTKQQKLKAAVKAHAKAKLAGASPAHLAILKKDIHYKAKAVNGGLFNKITGKRPAKAIRAHAKAKVILKNLAKQGQAPAPQAQDPGTDDQSGDDDDGSQQQ